MSAGVGKLTHNILSSEGTRQSHVSEVKDIINLIAILRRIFAITAKENNFRTSCLLYCRSSSFWKGVYRKQSLS